MNIRRGLYGEYIVTAGDVQQQVSKHVIDALIRLGMEHQRERDAAGLEDASNNLPPRTNAITALRMASLGVRGRMVSDADIQQAIKGEGERG